MEVKKRADPSPGRNPVPQVIQYEADLLKLERRWRIKPMIAALDYHPAVLREARSARIQALRYYPDRDRLVRV